MPCGEYRFYRDADRTVSATTYKKLFLRNDDNARIYLYCALKIDKFLTIYDVEEVRDYVRKALLRATEKIVMELWENRGTTVNKSADPEFIDLNYLGIALMQSEIPEMWYEALAYAMEILYKYSKHTVSTATQADLEAFARHELEELEDICFPDFNVF